MMQPRPRAPLLLASYLNLPLAYGLDERPYGCAPGSPVSSFPPAARGECGQARGARPRRPGVVQMVTPTSPWARAASRFLRGEPGFVHAVTMTGNDGARALSCPMTCSLMDRVRASRRSPRAGFAPQPGAGGSHVGARRRSRRGFLRWWRCWSGGASDPAAFCGPCRPIVTPVHRRLQVTDDE
jgi:hypothetical protein